MKKLNILIVEDDQMIAESLQDILLTLDHKVIGIADNADSAYEIAENSNPDLALLDIQINGDTDGLDLAKQIKEKLEIPFIFTTAFADSNTIELAKELGPYGYLVKPYGIKDVNVAIEIAFRNYQDTTRLIEKHEAVLKNDQLYVKTDSRLVRINREEILYIEAKGDYALFVTESTSYIVHSTMKNIEDRLGSSNFVKVHRSYIININHIVDIEDSNLLIQKKIIPISRSHKDKLLSRLYMI